MSEKSTATGGRGVVESGQIKAGQADAQTSDTAPDQHQPQEVEVAARHSTKAPAFQYYPKDFLSDDNQVAMTALEVGIYWRLVSHCWLRVTLPNDMARLARLAGVTTRQMTAAWPAMEPCFTATADGNWRHPRLDKERRIQRENREKRKAAADARWERERSNTRALHVECPATPTASATAVVEQAPRPTRGLSAGVQAGTTPRDHLRHAWCGETFRVCVPETLHGQLVRQAGGTDGDARLKAFYSRVEKALDPNQPITEDIFKFWKRMFSEQFAPPAAPVDGLTLEMRRNMERYADIPDFPSRRGSVA